MAFLGFKLDRPKVRTPDRIFWWYDKFDRGSGPITDILWEKHKHLCFEYYKATWRGFFLIIIHPDQVTSCFAKMRYFLQDRKAKAESRIVRCEARFQHLIKSLAHHHDTIFNDTDERS